MVGLWNVYGIAALPSHYDIQQHKKKHNFGVIQISTEKNARQDPIISGWWYTYPSEKYESQLGWWNSQYIESHKFMFQTTKQVSLTYIFLYVIETIKYTRYVRDSMPSHVNGQDPIIQTMLTIHSKVSCFLGAPTWIQDILTVKNVPR